MVLLLFVSSTSFQSTLRFTVSSDCRQACCGMISVVCCDVVWWSMSWSNLLSCGVKKVRAGFPAGQRRLSPHSATNVASPPLSKCIRRAPHPVLTDFPTREGHGHRGEHLRANYSWHGEPRQLSGSFRPDQEHGQPGGAAKAEVRWCLFGGL